MTAVETPTHVLPLTLATEDSVRDFGQLLGGPNVPNAGAGIPFYTSSVIEGANLDFRYRDRAVMRCAGILPGGGRERVRWLERHLHMTQVFIPLGTEPFVMVLAPPNHAQGGQLPAMDEVVAFVFPPGHGLLLHLGTWHDFPIAPRGPFTVLTMNSAEVVTALQRMEAPGEMDGDDIYKVDVVQRTGRRVLLDLTLPEALR